MKYLTLIILTVVNLSSCSKLSENDNYQQIVEEWQGRHVNLPEDMIDLITGDTIDISNSDFTILTYVDSAGCTGCKMKLSLWNEFLQSVEALTEQNIKALIIVDPTKATEVFHLIKRDGYEYPVHSDCNHRIYQSNNFNLDPNFNTLLLNSKFQTILIGSPINSQTIRNLYLDILNGKRLVSNNGKQDIIVNNNKIYLGRLHPGDQKTNVVEIKNMSNDTIRVRDILTSCECTNASIDNDYIPPKERISVSISFVADSLKGDFTRNVQLFYEGFDTPSYIELNGIVDN
ncbi:MAG: DUF1573 domain-containing protein [Muribaculum sp.]|nr:DUF1573 domain-containing protein [Muribaculum sp.]